MTLVRPTSARRTEDSHPTKVGPTPQPGPGPSRSAFVNPAYRSYLAATAVSYIGDAIWFVALGWGAAQLDDPVQASMVLAVGTIPRALLLPLGGAVADRFGVRRIMVGGDLVCAAVMVAATILLGSGHTSALLLAALAALVGLVDAANIPASSALPRLLLDEDQLPSGNGLLQLLGRLAIPVGAPLGGLLLAQGGLPMVTGVNALTFLCSATLVARLRPRVGMLSPPPEESLFRSMASGVGYVVRQPGIAMLLTVVTIANMVSGPVIAVGIPLRASREGWGVQGLGWFSACFAVGAGIGALGVIKSNVPLRRAGTVGMAWLVPQALLIASLGVAPSLPAALILGVFTGITAGPAGALLLGLVQGSVEMRFQARVMGLMSFAGLGLAPVAFTGYGLAVQLTSLQSTGILLGVAELLAAAYGLLWFLRRRPRARHATMRGGRHRKSDHPRPALIADPSGGQA